MGIRQAHPGWPHFTKTFQNPMTKTTTTANQTIIIKPPTASIPPPIAALGSSFCRNKAGNVVIKVASWAGVTFYTNGECKCGGVTESNDRRGKVTENRRHVIKAGPQGALTMRPGVALRGNAHK